MSNWLAQKIASWAFGDSSGVTSEADAAAAEFRITHPEAYNDMAMSDLMESNPELYAAKQQQEFEQASAREAMDFEAQQAQMNRDFQTSSNKIAMDFEAQQAQINRDWVDSQRQTSYQTAVADLKAAGLNPILAASNGGAATVSGSIASGISSSGSTASGSTASGSKASTDYSGSRELMQALISSAASIGLSVALRKFLK